MTDLYELNEPTVWAEPPKRFSFSSLQTIEECPRRWQLLNSAWGDYPKFPERPHPKALEGQIVHEGIDWLMRELGRRGLPSMGGEGFRAAVETVRFWRFFDEQVVKWNERLAGHPRTGSQFVIRTPPRELANQAIRLFRAQYVARDAPVLIDQHGPSRVASPVRLQDRLEAAGALTEVRLEHPALPVTGIIDLVQWVSGRVVLVDFKTGREKDSHLTQLQLYGLLWWRETSVVPSALGIQYLDRRRDFDVDESELIVVEDELRGRIAESGRALAARPAVANPGMHCTHCPVRPLCDEGWMHQQAAQPAALEGQIDLEVVVGSDLGQNGFSASLDGHEVHVVYDGSLRELLPRVAPGVRLRLVSAQMTERDTVRLCPWTEVYRVNA